MAMSLSEARSEIKNLFGQADLIEKRYPDGLITNGEDEKEVKRLLGDIDGLEAKLALLEDAETRRNRIFGGMERYSKPAPGAQKAGLQAVDIGDAKALSPGDQFLQSREYREMKSVGAFNSALSKVQFAVNFKDGTSLIQWKRYLEGAGKDLLYSGDYVDGVHTGPGGAFITPDRRPGYIDLRQRDLSVMDLIPRVGTESDTIEYVLERYFPDTATAVAEATGTTGTSGRKAEATMAFVVCTSPVRTIAHWLPVTNRMLADAPAIRGVINGRLLLALDLELEEEILNGDGAGEELLGILEAGIGSMDVTDVDSETLLDAIFRARTMVRTDGHGRPNAVVIHPDAWESIRLARETTATSGSYLMGPPSQVGAMTVWGIPVIESEAISDDVVLVGDFLQGCTLFDREQSAVRVGTINDQFVRNMQTILAELRAAFVVWRPAMFTQITGL